MTWHLNCICKHFQMKTTKAFFQLQQKIQRETKALLLDLLAFEHLKNKLNRATFTGNAPQQKLKTLNALKLKLLFCVSIYLMYISIQNIYNTYNILFFYIIQHTSMMRMFLSYSAQIMVSDLLVSAFAMSFNGLTVILQVAIL